RDAAPPDGSGAAVRVVGGPPRRRGRARAHGRRRAGAPDPALPPEPRAGPRRRGAHRRPPRRGARLVGGREEPLGRQLPRVSRAYAAVPRRELTADPAMRP